MNISVLQWNVWYKEDIHKVADFLVKHPADIICLQELTIDSPDQTVKDTPAYIAEQLGYNYFCKELPIESTDGTSMMLANGIFSRFPVINSSFTWINEPKSSGGYDDEYRALVKVSLDVEGKTIDIATTHMSYTHRFEGTKNKDAETDKLITALQKHSNPLVFMGDLNAIPGSYTINSLESFLQHTDPDLGQKTWTTKPFSYNGFEETKLNWRLDYIFTSKDMHIKSSEIIPTEISDHLPVRAHIELG